jgi:hypothetical protein
MILPLDTFRLQDYVADMQQIVKVRADICAAFEHGINSSDTAKAFYNAMVVLNYNDNLIHYFVVSRAVAKLTKLKPWVSKAGRLQNHLSFLLHFAPPDGSVRIHRVNKYWARCAFAFLCDTFEFTVGSEPYVVRQLPFTYS